MESPDLRPDTNEFVIEAEKINTNCLQQFLRTTRGELPTPSVPAVSTTDGAIPRRERGLPSSPAQLAIRPKPNVPEPKKTITPERQEQLNKELMQACMKKSINEALRLLQEGACPMALDSYGDNAFQTAAMYGCLPIIQAFITHGVDVDSAGSRGNTALHWASEHFHDNIVEFLLTQRANIDAVNSDGRTPLILAALEGNDQTTVRLIVGGAKLNHQDKTGSTALHYVVENKDEKYRKMAAALLVRKADPGIHDNNNYTPLHRAAAHNCTIQIHILLSEGANIEEIGGKHGTTPLHKACWEGSLEAVKTLLGLGANIRAKSGYDDNLPIHIAARKNFTEIGTDILDRDKDCISEKDSDGWTPLHIAARWNSVEFARLLISKGADPRVRNNASKTPRDLTVPIVQYSMRKLLEKAEEDRKPVVYHLNRDPSIYY